MTCSISSLKAATENCLACLPFISFVLLQRQKFRYTSIATLDSKTSTCKALQSSTTGKYLEPYAVNKKIHTESERLWPGPEIDNITADTCFTQSGKQFGRPLFDRFSASIFPKLGLFLRYFVLEIAKGKCLFFPTMLSMFKDSISCSVTLLQTTLSV